MAVGDRAELIASAARDTESIYRAARASIQIAGHGYQVNLPQAKDAGVDEGDNAPIHPRLGLLVISTEKVEASRLAADLVTIRGHGPYNVTGNVWERCADWFSADHHTTDACSLENPTGRILATSVMRGSSHLSHRSWCNRYRVAARSKNTPDSSTTNIGFRCVVNTSTE